MTFKENMIFNFGKMQALHELELKLPNDVFDKFYKDYEEQCNDAKMLFRRSEEFKNRHCEEM